MSRLPRSSMNLLGHTITLLIVTTVAVAMVPTAEEMAHSLERESPPPKPVTVDPLAVLDPLVDGLGWLTPRLAVIVLVVWLAARASKRHTYPWRTVGIARTVTESTSDEAGQCVNCWEDSGEPYELAYGRDVVVLGVVVWRRTDGVVMECPPCRDADDLEYAARAADPGGQPGQEAVA